MVEDAIGNAGTVPKEVPADAGYYSARAVEELRALEVDPFIAPEKTRHGKVLGPAPRGCIPMGLSARDRMRRKLRTKKAWKRYALRMETVEPVFGQIKQGRGFRQFPLGTPRPWKQRVLTTGRNALPEGREKDGSRCLNPLVRRTEDPREYAVPTSPKYAQAQTRAFAGAHPL